MISLDRQLDRLVALSSILSCVRYWVRKITNVKRKNMDIGLVAIVRNQFQVLLDDMLHG